jgi:SAM-dependent methyltransferase
VTEANLGERFDWIVGFFLLHHLADHRRSIENLTRLMNPGGRMALLEPNRRNPLFLLQVMACTDMTWAEEKGMFRLSQRHVEASYRSAGLSPRAAHHFGFFPPQIFNRSPLARRVEAKIESLALARPLLPFLLLSAQNEG